MKRPKPFVAMVHKPISQRTGKRGGGGVGEDVDCMWGDFLSSFPLESF
jgi:hypothetical protein